MERTPDQEVKTPMLTTRALTDCLHDIPESFCTPTFLSLTWKDNLCLCGESLGEMKHARSIDRLKAMAQINLSQYYC